MRIGYTQTLVCEQVENGRALLVDSAGARVPLTETLDPPAVGTRIDVFVYAGPDGGPMATRRHPYVQCGGCASLKVVATGPGGVFLDWGLEKHLLLPFAEQRRPLEVGQMESVLVYLDNSGRLAATSRLDHHLEEHPKGFDAWQSVDLLVYQRTELGYKAVADERAIGLIYASDVFQPVRPGLRVRGWVKRVREDGRLDLALQPPAREITDSLAERVIAWLVENDGVGTLTDRSSPEDIKARFQVSKKNYKRALSSLYKQRRIRLEADRVVLVQDRLDDDDAPVGEVDLSGKH